MLLDKSVTYAHSEWAYIQAIHRNNCVAAEVMDLIDWYTQERWIGHAFPVRIYAEDTDTVY